MANGDPNPPDDPLGGQPSLPEDDPNATQAEPDVEIPGGPVEGAEGMQETPEPGTEAEGIGESTSEVTQEAPLVEEEIPQPEEPIPQVPAFPIDVKPKSDVFTLMLVIIFLALVGTATLAGMEAYEHYDVQFWVFDKHGAVAPQEEEGQTEEAPAEEPPAEEAPPE